jgi:hypothetical protein
MLDQADVPTAHGSDVAEHSTVSGAVSDAVTNGIAAGAALVSTGLHAVAEIAKTGIRGQEEVEPVKEREGEGAEKGEEADGEDPKEAKQEGLRLQFGSFDESLAENILADAPTGDSSFVSSLHRCYVMFTLCHPEHVHGRHVLQQRHPGDVRHVQNLVHLFLHRSHYDVCLAMGSCSLGNENRGVYLEGFAEGE